MGYYDIVPKKSSTLPTIKKKIRVISIVTLVRSLHTLKKYVLFMIFLRPHYFVFSLRPHTINIAMYEHLLIVIF